MPKELKKYGLKAARIIRDLGPLATSCLVTPLNGPTRTQFIQFEPALVVAVGRALPHGCGPADPAYLHAVESSFGWYIWACYVSGHTPRVLWTTDTKPTWLKVKETSHASSSQAPVSAITASLSRPRPYTRGSSRNAPSGAAQAYSDPGH